MYSQFMMHGQKNIKHWNMIGRSMTDPPPVLSPSSALPPPLSHCAFIPATKNAAHFEMLFQFFLLKIA